MDKIIIEGLEVDTVIGVYDWEKTMRQTLVFDLWLGSDITAAANDDDIDLTIDYAELSERITDFVSSNAFELIETVAEQVAELIFGTTTCRWCRIKLSKPGAVPNARNVAVMIERERA